jgi:hypothetical protein
MEAKKQILKTIWINIAGIFLAVYLYSIISALLKIKEFGDLGQTLAIGFIGGLYLVIGYGFVIWIGFLIMIIPIELIFMNSSIERIKTVLIFEWIIISLPFIYWLIEYTEWVFLIAVLAFLITQVIRLRKIAKLDLPIN